METRGCELGEPVQVDGVAHLEATDRRSFQGRDMRPATEGLSDVLGQGAEIGPLGTAHGDLERVAQKADQVERMDHDRTWLALDRDPAMGQLVEPLAPVLERRVHGRHLGLLAQHGAEDRGDARRVHVHDRSFPDHLPFGVSGGRHHPELHDRPIALVGVEQEAGELGGLAETDRQ